MINPAQQRDLIDLRQAGKKRDHEQAQYALKRLLQRLSYYPALAIVAERLYSFLDIFESYYPHEQWVRTMLVALVSFGTSPDDSVPEMALQQPFSAPGCGNYIKAVYDLTQATEVKHTPESRVGYMASAIVNAHMAELAEAWYGEREAEWERVRQSQINAQAGNPISDTEAARISADFWLDESTAALDAAGWLEIANRIEKALHRQ
jgi:hypothetical protein